MKTNKGKKVRQYRSNQGRSPKQQNSNETAAFVSFAGLMIMFLAIAAYKMFWY
ncbi:hypothetical protein N9L94_06125 [Robiginitalea sp.]|jgi:hypothetical protein|nr:hypothetical protein [Robiginitalea sp.]|tara:strand:- start:344 stop:502 length:159 start_codon:yes stop_codon:yes gene_type:complete